ncbi:ergothioneine biosynthesis protein EgtB [soil metagenome]
MVKLLTAFKQVRQKSVALCEPLNTEDYVIQAMPDVSPAKWHLAHVTWFFETFILLKFLPNYQLFHKNYDYIFNSYYDALGNYYPRASRGILARPTVEEIYKYRAYVDEHMLALFMHVNVNIMTDLKFRIELGINHEQQHQELLLMDIKYNFSKNPLRPAYTHTFSKKISTVATAELKWEEYPGGLFEIGYQGENFAYDNECPRHKIYLQPFQLSNRLITNGEYLEFIAADAYKNPLYWLADGWQIIKSQQWQSPLYWEKINDEWWTMTLQGMHPVEMHEPVCHISYYEADAYARFVQARLPSEAEWEIAAAHFSSSNNFLETGLLHPTAANNNSDLQQMFGDLWEWTKSSYLPYPGFVPFKPPLSEYNSKFACNQFVLRGGCAVTPYSHFRPTYRNFFYPQQRWAFTGIRIARDL